MSYGLTTMLPRDPHSEKHSKYVLHKPKGVAFEQLCIGKPKNLTTGRGTAAPRGVTAEHFVSLETLQKQVRAARWHCSVLHMSTSEAYSVPATHRSDPPVTNLFADLSRVPIRHSSATQRSTCSRWTWKALNSTSSTR